MLTHFLQDPQILLGIGEVVIGFLMGVGLRFKFLKPQDITIALQLMLVGFKVLRVLLKNYHPAKRERNYAGVDKDLADMHKKVLVEHNLE